MRLGWRLVSLLGIAAGCADVFGIHEATEDAGADASIDSTVNDTGVDAGLDADADAVEELTVPDSNFATCDGALSALEPYPLAIYIDQTIASESAGCGAPKTPCKTIAFALSQYLDAGAFYVASGTYNENPQLQRNDVLVQGGFDDDGGGGWTQQCTTAATIVQDVTGPFGVNASTNVTLRFMTIISKPNGAAGESVTALYVHNVSTVTLDNVVLLAGYGGDGTPGGGGGDAGVGCTPWPSGGTGADGGWGAPGDGGWTFSGWIANGGSTGASGQTGVANAGSGGSCTAQNTCSGLPDSGFCNSAIGGNCCGADGGGGCGGFGGFGGAGGGTGGASVALYVWGRSTVTLKGGALFTTHGGNGGTGGQGGVGASGMSGFDGGSSSCCSACGFIDGGICGCSSLVTEPGGAGGFGGRGGSGGQGGAGAGGPTYLIVAGLDSGVTYATTVLDAGQPGSGGSPNGTAGSSGVIIYP